MCGIVGVIGAVDYKLEKVFSLMFVMDSIRGWHSSGIIAVKGNGDVVHDKALGTPFELQKTCSLFSDLKSCFTGTYDVLIGHNRHATAGKISVENAHPFDFENVIGVHNGTLEMWKCDFEKNGHEVDSHTLFHNINKKGLKKTIPQVSGAWSLAMYDKVLKRVTLIRNDKRPMYYAYTKNQKSVLFASEPWMIAGACYRYGVELASNPQATKEDYSYFWDVKNVRGGDEKIKFMKSSKTICGKPAVTHTPYRAPEVYNGHRRSADEQWGGAHSRLDKINSPASTFISRFQDRLAYLTDDDGYVGLMLNLTPDQMKTLDNFKRSTPIPVSIMGMDGYTPKVNATLIGMGDSLERERVLTEVDKPVFFAKVNTVSMLWVGNVPQINVTFQFNSLLPDSWSEVEFFETPFGFTDEREPEEPEENILHKIGSYFLSSSQVKTLIGTGCENCGEIVPEHQLKSHPDVCVWQNDVGNYSLLCHSCKPLLN